MRVLTRKFMMIECKVSPQLEIPALSFDGVHRDDCSYETYKAKQFTKLVSRSSVQEQEVCAVH